MCRGSGAQRVFLQASMCLWTPLVPVCVHVQCLWCPVPDRYLQKCLWAALSGFPLLKDPVDLKVDCHDVISPRRSSTPPCVNVTIHLRPPCEKKQQLYFHLCTDTDGQIKHWHYCYTARAAAQKDVLLHSFHAHSAHPNQCRARDAFEK